MRPGCRVAFPRHRSGQGTQLANQQALFDLIERRQIAVPDAQPALVEVQERTAWTAFHERAPYKLPWLSRWLMGPCPLTKGRLEGAPSEVRGIKGSRCSPPINIERNRAWSYDYRMRSSASFSHRKP